MENQQQTNGGGGGGGGGGRRPWAAFNIVERNGKRIWSRVGTAFQNHDGSMNIYLDSFPLGGKIQIREDDRTREPRQERGALAEEAVEA